MGRKFTNPLITEGRITVPKDIRDELGVRDGDRLLVEVEVLEDDG